MKNKVKIGLIGSGTVGQGVIKILKTNKSLIEKRVGAEVELSYVCDLKNPKIKGINFIRDYNKLINQKEIDIIVELIGGYEPARTIILKALSSGKNVVTANKAVLAKYWDEIFSTAHKNGCLVYFEASVGGGIPVIQALNEGLAGNKIRKFCGILNGTTNYVLSEMDHKGLDFKTALHNAKKAGFAEANPSFDINGVDTAHKLAILSSLAWSCWIKLGDMYVKGIGNIKKEDVYFAKQEFDYVIKLLGLARRTDKGVELSVEPCLIDKDHSFATVNREYNAISIYCDHGNDVMLYGKGAGQIPAASAVVSDIIFLSKQVASGVAGITPFVTYDPLKKLKIIPKQKISGSYYLRFTMLDKSGVLAKITKILNKHSVSIASVYQKQPLESMRKGVPILMLTHKVAYGDLEKAVKEIDRLSIATAKTQILRIIV